MRSIRCRCHGPQKRNAKTARSASGFFGFSGILYFRLGLIWFKLYQLEYKSIRALRKIINVSSRVEGCVVDGNAEKLTQAILAKAFRGELVPTEAELARRERREYEPAAVLLERIRKEREAVAAKQKKPRARKARLVSAT